MASVALSSVRKTYPGGFEAVRGVSLDIPDGEFVVLVGPSGCGKSTTLRMVAGLEDITDGTVSIGDRVVNQVHPKDRDIAMVFQNYALYPHMTVRANMAFALKLRGTPKAEIETRVRDAARLLGIEELLDRKPKALSGGQRQRVALGRAIVRSPRAFLFDEPLSNLDAKLRVTTRAELKSLHQRLKTTTIYVTHDQEEAMTLGDRIVVMSAGVIQQAAPPLEVYRHPANRFVAEFVGTPPMNFLEGVLEASGDDVAFREDGSGGLVVTLTREQSAKVRNRARQRVVLGIRPQHLIDRPPTTMPSGAFKVRVVEPLGDTMDLTCVSPGGKQVVARVPASVTHSSGETATLGVDAALVHVFEPGEYGANLTLGVQTRA
ncbi:MAG: ABC transporter ATP-binding protein [Phycisphaerales bacterium]